MAEKENEKGQENKEKPKKKGKIFGDPIVEMY